ncbi:hypothetical protein JCM3766R1_004035 [Sporobolomyces carnicolor]
MKFTDTMLERYANELGVATKHAFLTEAGRRTLSREKLSEWLTQDRVYALSGYPKFVAGCISRLQLQSAQDQRTHKDLLGLFAFALSNIDREVDFFDSLGPKYDLDLEFRPPPPSSSSSSSSSASLQGSLVKPTTRAYVDLLVATGVNASIDEQLVLLWGMEKIYLAAWTHAKSQTPCSSSTDINRDDRDLVSRALDELIRNWTMPEFVDFVARIEREVDKLQLEPGTEAWQRCEEMFKYNLLLEQQFWPEM